jgi:hypothetical protein
MLNLFIIPYIYDIVFLTLRITKIHYTRNQTTPTSLAQKIT